MCVCVCVCVCVCFGSKRAACCFDLGLYLFLPDRRLQASSNRLEPETRARLLLGPMGKRCPRNLMKHK